MSWNVAESKADLLKSSKRMLFDMENKRKDLNLGKAAKDNSVNWRQDWLLNSYLSLNASCSSEASTDSFVSRASTGRFMNSGFSGRKRRDNVLKMIQKGGLVNMPINNSEKRRCGWVTPNTDPSYIAFHDEEWGVPVHDDKKLFELLVLSSALSELSWPVILSKRQLFREVFMDFDPGLVSKLNEKKMAASGSTASTLLSEPKLRAIIENSRHILRIIEEFGSLDRYCWNFVNRKPTVNEFRYSRQIPAKTPKADMISRDLMRRGFRYVGPTIIYSFMQVAGLTNDHLTCCFRFDECADIKLGSEDNNCEVHKMVGKGRVQYAGDMIEGGTGITDFKAG